MRPPAFCLSGGKLSDFGNAIEYRVWIHPNEGDDCFLRSKNFYELLEKRARLLKDPQYAIIEPVIAVVFDKKFKKYREVWVDGIDYGD